MTQDMQMLKSEITSSLDLLSPESLQLLAKFVSFLRTGNAETEVERIVDTINVNSHQQMFRITSPRLVHRHQVVDFEKEIIDITE